MNELIPDQLTIINHHYQGLASELVHLREDQAKLYKLLSSVIQDNQANAASIIDSSRLLTVLNSQDYLRSLQMGGYGFTVSYPSFQSIASAALATFSLFNTGSKTLAAFSMQGTTHGSNLLVSAQGVNADPAYANNGSIANHKIGVNNSPAVSVTFNNAIAGTQPVFAPIANAVIANQATVEMLTNNHVITLPSKTGIILWISGAGAATQTQISIDLVELPF